MTRATASYHMIAVPAREGRVGEFLCVLLRAASSVFYRRQKMERLIERVCGLDVGSKTVHACALLDDGGRKPRIERKEFPTHAEGLSALRAWLVELGVTHVAVEATGVYWMPIYAALEDHATVIIANARHIKQVPGRKTDVSDAQWLANLIQLGLLKGSFVLPKPIRPIRDLTRYRRSVIHARTRLRNQILKLIEQVGIKLASVASNAFGRSGMDMLNTIANGDASPKELAMFARARMKSKRADLELAFGASLSDQHRFILQRQLASLASLDADVAAIDGELRRRVAPYQKELELLMTIPGVHETAAIDIFAEIGPDVSAFDSEAKFASWSGLCPGNNITGGKSRRARRRSGNPYLQSILFECALSATRKKGSYFRAKHARLSRGRSKKCSIFAIAHKLGRTVHRVLAMRVGFADLGEHYLDRRDAETTARHLIKRLAGLGLTTEAVNALYVHCVSSPTT
jgi:transposase